jgi:hypothetical protein
MDDMDSQSQSHGCAIDSKLDFPPSVTTPGQNTQCVTMLKIRAAAGDRVQLLQVTALLQQVFVLTFFGFIP